MAIHMICMHDTYRPPQKLNSGTSGCDSKQMLAALAGIDPLTLEKNTTGVLYQRPIYH